MQTGLLSEDDAHSSININMTPQNIFEQNNLASRDSMDSMLIDDDNFMLDTNQDLPIRKPQSAYVIFGKMVRV